MVKRHIYIFRHGQSFFNKQHKFTGWKDSKLTQQGFRDARKIARKLKDKKIDVAFCSHLTRSKDTLNEVLKYHPECKTIIVNDKIIERSYGELEGKTHNSDIAHEGLDSYKTLLHWHKIDHLTGKDKEKFVKAVGKAEFDVIHRSYSVPPPGGESVRDVKVRVDKFIKELLRFMKREKVNVAISAHGNSMRPFRAHFEKLSKQEMMELENPWDDYFHYSVEV